MPYDDIPFFERHCVLYFPNQNRYNLYCKLAMSPQKGNDRGHTGVQPWFPWNRNLQGHKYADFIFGLEGMNKRFESVFILLKNSYIISCYISCIDYEMILCSITNNTTLPLCTTLSFFFIFAKCYGLQCIHFPAPLDYIWSQTCSVSSPLMCHAIVPAGQNNIHFMSVYTADKMYCTHFCYHFNSIFKSSFIWRKRSH